MCRRGLRQRARKVAQHCKLAFRLRLVDSIEIRGPEEVAHGIAERHDLLRRHHMFGDVEQHDRKAVIVRRTHALRDPVTFESCTEIFQHAPQVVVTAE